MAPASTATPRLTTLGWKSIKEAILASTGLETALELMETDGSSIEAQEVFAHYYRVLESGSNTLIAERDILPFTDPLDGTGLKYTDAERQNALSQTVLIRLNGGLGTSMGLQGPKTLLTVRDQQNFLDICVHQVLADRERYDVDLPLIFMDSYSTDAETLAYLRRYPTLPVDGLPLSFLQSREPRLVADTLAPLVLEEGSEEQWCPPGHGDIYPSLKSSGLLDLLLERGYRYAQVANGDNLGAALDPDLAAWFASTGHPFAMEVCRRTSNDRKGGHLARSKDTGRLILRELAQTPQEDLESFQDIGVHQYFNTNTIWLDLVAVADLLNQRGAALGLPLIRNTKQIATDGAAAVGVIQIETAMGAAIEVFEGACAVEVSRSRFLPVKTTNELLLVRSDLYNLDPQGRLVATKSPSPRVILEPLYYGKYADFEARIPMAPSLRSAHSLTVEGDWYFQPGSHIVGDVLLGESGGIFGP